MVGQRLKVARAAAGLSLRELQEKIGKHPEIGAAITKLEMALNDLAPGDVLAVAGKGHEQGQTVGATVLPFDDVTVVRRLAGVA